MPVERYFKGEGDKVMKSMKKNYGDKEGERVFYATANAKHMTPDMSTLTKGKPKGKKKSK